MGVKGLWDLISPSGRVVRFDTLEGRKVAVDASIWLVQFLKALRNKEGNVFRGAHLIGFFKRLCKLHYYRICPIIVFDGPAPDLKRRTINERKARRDEEISAFRKTAHRLVVNFVKRKAIETRRRRESGDTQPSPEYVPTIRDILTGKTRTPPEEYVPGSARTILTESDSDTVIDIDGEVFAKHELDTARGDIEEAVARQAERRRQRHAYYESIPEEFRGFMAERRALDQVHIPTQSADILDFPGLTARQKLAAFGITINDVDEDLKLKAPILGQEDEFKAFAVRNEHGEESFVSLPMSANIDEKVFRELPSREQYKVLCWIRDKWLSELRLHAVAAKDQADVFSNVQIESYIRTIRSNQEIEKVKKRMGEEIKLRHFGPDPLGVSEIDHQDDGGFLDFYPSQNAGTTNEGDNNIALEEKIKRSLQKQHDKSKETAAASAMRQAVAELDDPGTNKRNRRKHLSLFRQWELEQEDHPILLTEKQPVQWTRSKSSAHTVPVPDSSSDDTDEYDEFQILEDMLTNTPQPDKVSAPIDPKENGTPEKKSSVSTPLSMKRKIRLKKPLKTEEDEWDDFCDAPDFKNEPAQNEPTQAHQQIHQLLAEHMTKIYQSKHEIQHKTHQDHIFPPAPALQPRQIPVKRSIPNVQAKAQGITAIPSLEHLLNDVTPPDISAPNSSSTPPAVLVTPSSSPTPPAVSVTPSSSPTPPAVSVTPLSSPTPPSSPPLLAFTSSDDRVDDVASTSLSPPAQRRRVGDVPIVIEEVSVVSEAVPLVIYQVDSPAGPLQGVEERPSVTVEEDVDDFSFSEFIPQSQVEEVPESEPPAPKAQVPVSSESNLESDLDEGLNWFNMSSTDFERNLVNRSRPTDYVRDLMGSNTINLDDLAETLEEEAEGLLRSLRKSKARADQITEEMQDEIRQLCRAFGVPYIQAPSEAEAQAAWLVENGMAEAVISDDSDTMVFGANEVFRGFFSDAKGIELYSQREITRCLGLTVSELRILALLLGCDYTLGVKGIGIVNALEVVAAYPDIDELDDFYAWAKDLAHVTDPGIKETDSDIIKDYKVRHRGYRSQWEFPRDFPPRQAYQAFTNPRVDTSKESFTWAMPDVDEILVLMRSKAGLQSDKVLETLTPVMNRMRETAGMVRRQALVDTFLLRPAEDAVAIYRSERLRRTINILTKKESKQPKRRRHR